MFYKLSDNIFFRMFNDYGVLTDNNLFAYKYVHNNVYQLPDKCVSKSAAVMLSILTREPQNINSIIDKLINIFNGVDYNTLRLDVIEFFDVLVEEGYLIKGKSIDTCVKRTYTHNDNKRIVVVENKKSQIDEIPILRSVHIEISDRCNEKCVHCFIPSDFRSKEMTPEMFYDIVNQAREQNVINITISGGEPLIHPNIIDFLNYCRKKDLSVNLLTNLTLLTDDILEEIKMNPNCSVQVSLYSIDATVHDSITQIKGSYSKTKNNLLKLIKEKIPVQISCPIIKENVDSFDSVILWADQHNIGVTINYEIFGSCDHSNENLRHRLSIEDVGLAFDKVSSDEYIKSIYEKAKGKCAEEDSTHVCNICRMYFCVSTEGNVFPCVGWKSRILGNINKKSLKEIWENSSDINYLREIRQNDFKDCTKCSDRGYCTICMMVNANENPEGEIFKINPFHCQMAHLLHLKTDKYLGR